MEAHGEKQPASARDLKAGQSTLASSLPDWTQFDPIAGAQAAAHATMDAASQAATQASAAAASLIFLHRPQANSKPRGRSL